MTITTNNNPFHTVQQYLSSYNTQENRDLARNVTLALATLTVGVLIVRAYNKGNTDEIPSTSTGLFPKRPFKPAFSDDIIDASPSPHAPATPRGPFSKSPSKPASSNDKSEASPSPHAPVNVREVASRVFVQAADQKATTSTSLHNKNGDSNCTSNAPSQSLENNAALLRAINDVLSPENKRSATESFGPTL